MPTEKPKVFLCYAHADHDRVEALYEKLSEAGFTPWMAPKNIMSGEKWRRTLLKAIKEAPFFLACLSNNSVDRRGVIQAEIKQALSMWREKHESDIYFHPSQVGEV